MSRNQPVLIQYKTVSKMYSGYKALDQISFKILKGEILGFLGPNGAGKTTTMKLLAGLLNSNDGEICIHTNYGFETLTRQNRDRLLSNIGFFIDYPVFYDMTPRKLLTYFAKLKGYPRHLISSRVEEIVELFKLSSWIDQKISKFSKGMKQKIGILSAVVHDPDILVLDEPQSGLDPAARKEVRELLMNLKASGKTIFLSSHLLYEITEVADRVIILSNGKIIASNTIENLKELVKQSIIRLEVLNHLDIDIGQIVIKIKPLLSSLHGLGNTDTLVSYNPKSRRIEIYFDGNQTNQYLILKILIENGIEIIEFSVPKINLLENLYLNLVEKNEQESNINTKFLRSNQMRDVASKIS